MSAVVCSCGAEVMTAEIRVVERCSKGHFVRSSIAPTSIALSAVAPRPITPGQLRGLHGKANRLDVLNGKAIGATKRELLGERSANTLNETEATALLDRLEAELVRLGEPARAR